MTPPEFEALLRRVVREAVRDEFEARARRRAAREGLPADLAEDRVADVVAALALSDRPMSQLAVRVVVRGKNEIVGRALRLARDRGLIAVRCRGSRALGWVATDAGREWRARNGAPPARVAP